MAGRGSRFKKVGVSSPKHEIDVDGKPMFDWAMRSLTEFFDDRFLFVAHDDHDPASFLSKSCDRLGIDDFQVVSLDTYTTGQAATAYAADHLLDPEESVAIYNIDTYIEKRTLAPGSMKGDGWIPVFETPGERWSFVETDDSGAVIQVSEKDKISDLATVGFYYFDRWQLFTDAFETASDDVESEYGETYVAPLYNHIIDSGHDVRIHPVDQDDVHVLGTPGDLREFDPTFDPETN